MGDPIRAALERAACDLQEARDAVCDWGAYASEYFQEKHDLAGELQRIDAQIARARAALAAEPEPPPLSLADPVSAVAAAVTPAGGYEPGCGLMDGAQLVNDEWWEPEFGCDSLEKTLDAIRARLVTAITDWQRAALAAARAALAAAHPTYCWEVRTAEGEPCASGDAPTAEEAEREGRHYFAQYQQDGPHRLRVWVEYSILEVSDD